MARRADILLSSGVFTGTNKSILFRIFQQGSSTLRQDITGWTLSCLVKAHKTDADASAVVTKTTTSGITLTDAVNGEATMTLTPSDGTNLTAEKTYYYELMRTNTGAKDATHYGVWVLNQAVHD